MLFKQDFFVMMLFKQDFCVMMVFKARSLYDNDLC